MRNRRFNYVVVVNFLYGILYAVPKANYMIKHKDKYDEQKKFEFACRIMNRMRKSSRTTTKVYGKSNLPKERGYILYSNHQGKYDALGILLSLGIPCGVLWEKKQADKILGRQVCGLLQGVKIDLKSIRDKVSAIKKVIEEVNKGRNFLIFPEGGYGDNQNKIQNFNSGCFSCSLKTKTPIVPVAIYDSYKAMNSYTFEKVETQVHFLEPIYYREYKNLKKNEIADLVKQRIEDKINEIESL